MFFSLFTYMIYFQKTLKDEASDKVFPREAATTVCLLVSVAVLCTYYYNMLESDSLLTLLMEQEAGE